MRGIRTSLIALVVALGVTLPAGAAPASPADAAADPAVGLRGTLLASGLAGGSGSTIGPDGALYVTEGSAGRISRVDPGTGEVTTVAEGLPQSVIGIGGVMDVAFRGRTLYALVTLVGRDFGGSDVVGVYRIDGPRAYTVVADIGAWATANPPRTEFMIPSGLQYAMQPFGNGFLVTDGHHNRVLRVSFDGAVVQCRGGPGQPPLGCAVRASREGAVSQVREFDNIVPTGLDVRGHVVSIATAGPVPHLPADGRVLEFAVGATGSAPARRRGGGRIRGTSAGRRRARARGSALRLVAG